MIPLRFSFVEDDKDKDIDEKMERHREVLVELAMHYQTELVEACHSFIKAVNDVRVAGLPHGIEDDGHFDRCAELAREFLDKHFKNEDRR